MYRFRLATVSLGLVALAFMQDPGRVASDTKLDLSQNPWGFLTRALHFWDPQGFFGQLQNQAYGYLLPMGPFFGIGTGVGLPPWVVQRLWWSTLLVAAFLGVVRLTRLLGVQRGLPRVVAGLSYVLAARILTTLGPISSETLPMALAPWLLVPLVTGSRGGSPRRAAAASAIVVALVSGINAVATAAILPLGIWWLLTREPGPRRRRLMGFWVVAVGLASAWFVLPLLLLGRYSPPFLDWIESSAVTTSVTSPDAVLRGVSHWVAYLADGAGPLWQSGWTLITSPTAVAGSAAVAAVGLAGLALPGVRERRFLLLVLLTGLVWVGLGHVGEVQGIGSQMLRDLLDGPLAPLRNVHKAQPLVTLPLAVGVAWAVSALQSRAARRRAEGGMRFGLVVQGPALIAIALVMAAVAAAALPAWTGVITRGRSYTELPQYWREAADWLGLAASDGRALVVPATAFGTFWWGRPQDEPMQPLASSPWGVRDGVPISSAGNIRLLDAVEASLEDGRGGPGLAAALRRAGVTYLLVRNDLEPVRTGVPRPIVVHQALAQSPGLTRVAFFGPVLVPFVTEDIAADAGLGQAYPAVEIFAVEAAGQPDDTRAVLRDASTVVSFGGGTESLLPLSDAGVLDPGRTAVWQGDPVPPGSRVVGVQTDGARRTEVNFGLVRGNRSTTMTNDDAYRLERRVHDYLLAPQMPTARADLLGARAVTASTAGGDADAVVNRAPGNGPWAALDGDPDSTWLPGRLAAGPAWWEVDLDRPVTAPSVRVRLARSGQGVVQPRALQVSTDRGERDVAIDPDALWQQLPLPGGKEGISRVRISQVRDDASVTTFGLAEVSLPGVKVERPIVAVPAAAAAAWVLRARDGERPGCIPTRTGMACAAGVARAGEDRAGLDRVIEVPQATPVQVSVTVRPRPGPALDRLLDEPVHELGGITAEADSRLVVDPAARPQSAVDGDLSTAWLAAAEPARPTLVLKLPGERLVSGLRLFTSLDLAASRPFDVTVDTGTGQTRVFVPRSGVVRFPPARTTTLTLSFGVVSPVRSTDSRSGTVDVLPLGISEIKVLGEKDLRVGLSRKRPVALPCGSGPSLLIDGTRRLSTSVTTTVGELVAGRTMKATPCTKQPVVLSEGQHRMAVEATSALLVDAVTLTGDLPARTTAAAPAEVAVWEPTHREVVIASAPTTRTLELSENANPGWTASVDGQELEPLRVDGWRQAFVVPAGVSGTVVVEFGPDRFYRAALLVGATLFIALLALAVWPSRRAAGPPVGPRRGRGLLVAALVIAVAAVAGPVGLTSGAAAALVVVGMRRRGRDTAWQVALGFAGAAGVLQVIEVTSSSTPAPWWLSTASALLVVAGVSATGARAVAAEPRAGSS